MKGLNGGEGGSEEGEREQEDSSKHKDKLTVKNAAPRKTETHPRPQNQQRPYDSYAQDQDSFKVVVALPKDEFSGGLKDLDEKVNSMIGRSKNMVKYSNNRQMIKAYVCQVCGKEGLGLQIRDHIEANHLEGISIPCNICNQTVRSRNALTKQKSKHHTNSV